MFFCFVNMKCFLFLRGCLAITATQTLTFQTPDVDAVDLNPGEDLLQNAGDDLAQEVVMAAHLARVDLSAHGFYATPEITGFGGDRPFSYFTYGAAASEVELDTLSGDFQARPMLVLPRMFLQIR